MLKREWKKHRKKLASKNQVQTAIDLSRENRKKVKKLQTFDLS